MPTEYDTDGNRRTIILTLLPSLLSGGVLGALINQFFAREKTPAEAEKTEAEAEKIKAETAKILQGLNVKASPIADSLPKEVNGWLKAGSEPTDYEIGVDQKETYHGKFSAYIKSRKESPRGFGTLMQTFKANVYAGKRLKMSGSAKSEGV